MTSTTPVNGAAPTELPTELPTEVLTDTDLYRASGMVDVLRDSAKDLLGCPVSTQTLDRMRSRYIRLRAAAAGALTSSASSRLLNWTDALGEPVTAIDEIFDAAATLARSIDLAIGLPGYVLARRSAEAEMQAMLAQLPPAGSPAAGGRGADRSNDRGQYL